MVKVAQRLLLRGFLLFTPYYCCHYCCSHEYVSIRYISANTSVRILIAPTSHSVFNGYSQIATQMVKSKVRLSPSPLPIQHTILSLPPSSLPPLPLPLLYPSSNPSVPFFDVFSYLSPHQYEWLSICLTHISILCTK